MRLLTYYVASTLDGFIADRDDRFDAFLAEGDHIADFFDSLSAFDTVLMGRRTYEVGLRAGVADPYPTMTTYVFSRSLTERPHEKITVVADDEVAFVAALKRSPGQGIWLCGGGRLAATLLAAGLIDELAIKLHPVLLGAGIPIVAAPDRRAFALVDTKRYASGVMLLRYRVSPAVT
jgi:dihydrofolate reductase